MLTLLISLFRIQSFQLTLCLMTSFKTIKFLTTINTRDSTAYLQLDRKLEENLYPEPDSLRTPCSI